MILALPIGYLADHISHRKVFGIIVAGILGALLWTILIGRCHLTKQMMVD